MLARVGLVVVVIALERADSGGVDDLAYARLRVDETAVVVERRHREVAPILVHDLDVVTDQPESTDWCVVNAGDGHAALRGAEGVDHSHAEAAAELLDHFGTALVPVGDAQRVVGVIGAFGRGQYVGERLAGVVEVGRAVATYVGQPARRGEPAGQSD